MITKFSQPQIMTALIDDFNIISVFFTEPVSLEVANMITLFENGKVSEYHVDFVNANKAVLQTNKLNIKHLYTVAIDQKIVEVIPHYILDKEQFIYREDDLGLTYSKNASTFKVWAPTATEVLLNLYDNLQGDNKRQLPLTEKDKGVWAITVNENLLGKVYSFCTAGALSSFDISRELNDPYSKCVLGMSRRSLVIDIDSYQKIESAQNNFPIKDAILYECHVRDISIDSTANAGNFNGKYLALTQNNTNFENTPTLLSHFKELGVNTIQIMPIQDYDNDESDNNVYGWGYMPRHFNSPDGLYATDWTNDSKIKEVLQMVDAIHKAGLKVTLDVVYNHTAEGFFGEGIESFNGFVPYYYYRIAGNGYVSNGSGCGNEFRTESPMGRKFIIDSLKFWTQFYKFDGFRFDLMGLIDLETCKAIVYNLKQINNNIFVYGEPWTGGLTPIQPTYKGTQRNCGFSVFNDDFRDAVKGAVFNKMEKGYVQSKGNNNYDKIIEGIKGSINTFTAMPSESINYVEVHDNNTLFDKLYFTETGKNEFTEPSFDEINIIKDFHKLTAFILLTSQGVPVLHLGQDFMRTKYGIENSYNSSDVINKIDWSRKVTFHDVFEYYKNLIEIRNSHPLFRLFSNEEVNNNLSIINDFPIEFMHCIKFCITNGKEYDDSVNKILVIINPYPQEITINLGENYKKMLVGNTYYKEETEYINEICIPKLSGNIFYQK